MTNSYRRLANEADARADKWEALAKKSKASGNTDLAIIAARQARRNRNDARKHRKLAEE